MSVLAVSTQPRETFAVRLAYAAAVTELEAWFAAASVGDQARYASGIDLPRAEPGVALVTRWKDAGLVVTTSKRDPQDGRRWLFIVQKTENGRGCPPVAATGPARAPSRRGRGSLSECAVERTKAESEALLELLRGRAAAGRPCPGLTETAQLLGLPGGRRGKNRANYLFGLLEREGRIAVCALGGNRGRVVTIRAKGRAQGKSTGEPS